MTSSLIFKTLKQEHLSDAQRLSEGVKWPHRLLDWEFVSGFSMGVVAMAGERVVATALATPFAPVGMVNMIIVDSDFRGRGIGRDIMVRAMQSFAPDAWRLVSTQGGLPLYDKFGFRIVGEVLQHQGRLRAVSPCGVAEWATADQMAAIVELDAIATGIDRQTLFKALAGEAHFAVLRDGVGITGFAAVRDFGRGEVAGPVIARNPADAKSLLSLIMAERNGRLLRVDTNIDTGLSSWLVAQGLTHVGGGWQMQKGELTETSSGSPTIFALASQALG